MCSGACLDVTLCERLLGVRAKVGLEEGLLRTIAWQREARKQPSYA